MNTFTAHTGPALLPHPAGRGYLNTAAVGLPAAPVVEALESALADWAGGRAQPARYDEDVEASMALFRAARPCASTGRCDRKPGLRLRRRDRVLTSDGR